MAYIRKLNQEELRKELRNWRTSRLKQVYMHHFRLKEKHPEIKSQLELIIELLSQRGFDERLKVYHHVREMLNEYVKKEDYENASLMQQMLEHYHMHILD